jgi:hypothetical protein
MTILLRNGKDNAVVGFSLIEDNSLRGHPVKQAVLRSAWSFTEYGKLRAAGTAWHRQAYPLTKVAPGATRGLTRPKPQQ